MAFFNSALSIIQTILYLIGAGLGIWGAVNLLEGYGQDNPGARSQGIKQFVAGIGIFMIGTQFVEIMTALL